MYQFYAYLLFAREVAVELVEEYASRSSCFFNFVFICKSIFTGAYIATNLTAAIQDHVHLAMRHGGALSGVATTAPAQLIGSAVERFISEKGAELERRGTEPNALRRVQANAAQGKLTLLEACLVNDRARQYCSR